jgi:hypothetical protein
MQSPIRRDDLVHSQASLRRCLEEFIWRDRLSLTQVEAYPFGFVVHPSLSPHSRAWLGTQKSRSHLWTDSIELDSFGSQLIIARAPYGLCAGFAAWQDAPLMANLLRLNYIGPALWGIHKSSLLACLIEELAPQFELVKRPLNTQQLPAYADTEWGVLVLLRAEQAPQLLDYFHLPSPKDPSIPMLAKLGGNVSAVLAFGPETVRLGLCWNGLEDPVVLNLQDWLRSVHISPISAT